MAKAGGKKEEGEIDDVEFVKETKGKNLLAVLAIKLHEQVQGEACDKAKKEK